jgi:hypothetical protein
VPVAGAAASVAVRTPAAWASVAATGAPFTLTWNDPLVSTVRGCASVKVVSAPSPVPIVRSTTDSSGTVRGSVAKTPMKPAVLVPTPAMALTAEGTSST